MRSYGKRVWVMDCISKQAKTYEKRLLEMMNENGRPYANEPMCFVAASTCILALCEGRPSEELILMNISI